jgi:hypothetical protein
MSSFSDMSRKLDPASPADIEAYRAWFKKHAPIDASEARFLERKDDLLAVSRRKTNESVGSLGGPNPYQRAAVALPLIAVLPLMVFGIVPGLLGRLFIITLIGTAEVLVVTSSELMGLMTVREWFICASM